MRSIMICLMAGILLAAVPATADEDYGDEVHDYAFGVGAGLVDPDGEVETYLSASFRIRLGKHDRDRYDVANQGIQGFIEPEVGYWESDTSSDTLVGANLLGLVPFNRVDYYFGVGAGVHFLDTDFPTLTGTVSESDERLGVNAQFGLDVHLSDSASLFGTGRFDLVEGSDNEVQEKAYLGVRFRF